MVCCLCFSAVAGFPVGIDHFTILIVRKADGAIVAPIPAFVGDNGIPCAVGICDFQLSQQLRFCTVLISDAPCAAATPIPAVC